ncbi:MAG TPA: DUF3662 and FHA domain-containing protein [Dermatophilaceae bacterium]|nr:DUF3662 and FHA domain-containing protein [Dermatophilaceae bacterium]
MGIFDKVERALEGTVNKTFAKVFRSEVQPVEIASAIRRAMDDRASAIAPGRTMVPHRYDIELSSTDYDRLTEYADAITDDLVAAAQEHAETQAYQPGGPIEVVFGEADDLETGVFRVRPSTGRSASSGMPPAAPPAPGSPAGVVGSGAAAASPYARPEAAAPAPAPAPAPARPERPAHHEVDPSSDAIGLANTELNPPPKAPPVNPAKRPWLDIDGERYPLLGSLTIIGRDATADVILDDPGISRRHSELRVTHDGPHLVASIRDLASTNGTFVNGERITSVRLEDGDRITVGRTTMHYRAGKR